MLPRAAQGRTIDVNAQAKARTAEKLRSFASPSVCEDCNGACWVTVPLFGRPALTPQAVCHKTSAEPGQMTEPILIVRNGRHTRTLVTRRRRRRRIPIGESGSRLSDLIRQPVLQNEHRDVRGDYPCDCLFANVSRSVAGSPDLRPQEDGDVIAKGEMR